MIDLYADYEARGWPSIDPRSRAYCYQPCDNGLHVVSEHPDGVNCMTVVNILTRTADMAQALFALAADECGAREGEPDDLTVDLMMDGVHETDFSMPRQMLDRLRLLALPTEGGESHEG